MTKEIELTPEHLRCDIGASCPGVWKILTPEGLKCGIGQCPTVAQNKDMLKIIGFANPDGTGEEVTCYLPKAYFANL